MKNQSCLSDQDLTLHYYGEFSENEMQKQHVADCQQCAARLEVLSHDLARLPNLMLDADAFAGSRMAAKVNEQIRGKSRKKWFPAIGATTVAVLALVVSFTLSPRPESSQVTQSTSVPFATLSLEEDMPDIDFLEDLELLRDLELLAQIEGV